MYENGKNIYGCLLYILIITSLFSFFAGSVTILIEYGTVDIEYIVLFAFMIPFLWYKKASEKLLGKLCIKYNETDNKNIVIFENTIINYVLLILSVVIYYVFVFVIVDLFEKIIAGVDSHHNIVYVVAIITMLPYGDLVSRVLYIEFRRRNT